MIPISMLPTNKFVISNINPFDIMLLIFVIVFQIPDDINVFIYLKLNDFLDIFKSGVNVLLYL
jgi:hypothetical protein